MKITIWSDFQCPFCYIGEKMLEDELGSMELTEPVVVEYKSYELDPEAPVVPRETMTEHFMGGHEMTAPQAEERMAKITRMAADVGLTYNLAGVQVCNTLDAHRLMKYAAGKLTPGRLKRLNFSLFKANFEDNLRLSDHEVLASLAVQVGLQRDEVLEMLGGDAYAEAVRKDEAEIDARPDFEFVPYMLLANGAVLQGVLKPRNLRQWLTGAMADSGNVSLPEAPREGCGPGGCAV